MEYRDTRLPVRTPRPEPSWPVVIATTLRLWLERHPVVIGRKKIYLRPLLALARAVEHEDGESPAGAAPKRPVDVLAATAGLLVRRRFAVLAVAAGLLVTGAGGAGLVLEQHPAGPHWAAAVAVAAPVGPMAGAVHSQSARVPAPVALTIPAIGVQTSLMDLGLTSAGTLQVPPSTAVAGWYTGSSRPGALGPAVIAGHIDSHVGPGVFFHLAQLRPGDDVYVRRADGTLAVFRVTQVESYAKDRFPTLAVYGPTPDAELRLITCGGTFDYQLRSYLSNTVVYAVQLGAGT